MSAIRKNVAGQHLPFALVNASDGAALPGATVTVLRCIDGGAQAAATGTVSEKGNGQYDFAPSAADVNGNQVGFLITAPGAIPAHLTLITTAADPTNSTTGGLANLDAAVSSIVAAVWAYATRRLTVTAAEQAAEEDDETLALTRGDTWTRQITGLGSLADADKVWLTVKHPSDLDDKDDEAALFQLTDADGLVRLNGEEGTAADGSIDIDDPGTGDITATLQAAAAWELSPSKQLRYDVQKLVGSTVSTLRSGKFYVLSDVTRSRT